MDIAKTFKNFKPTPINILKASGLFLLAIIVISIVFQTIAPTVRTVTNSARGFATTQSSPAYDGDYYYGTDDAYAIEEAAYGYSGGEGGNLKLSLSNIGIPSPIPPRGGTVGDDAEDFEVTEYNVSIETRDRDVTCTEISGLKDLSYVVFENANEYDRGCNYTFKVQFDNVEEILTILEEFNPEELSENTYTIKRQIDDFTSETEILESKLESIDETLENALDAYDEITSLATQTQNADALAKIIDSKIGIIERLTQERINITAQLERLERAKAEQLDKLEYTYFYVNVYENKFVDGENLKDSWKAAIKGAVRDINRTVQDVTVNLVTLIFTILQYILYFLILLVVVKYLWRVTKYIWKK